jgi:hypothetical protein
MPAGTRVASLLALIVAACGGGGGGAARPRLASPRATIEWQRWGAAVFDRARSANRLVLVDIGIEGCTACRWMYEDTYRDPAVVRRVREHFVPVAVDANVRPDLGARWQRWGWPATIVLTPDGERVLALRGNRRPRSFVPILDALIARQAAGRLQGEGGVRVVAAEPAGELGALCGASVARMATLAEPGRAGYGGPMHHALGAPVRWELFRGHATGETARTEHALATLTGYARMIDPVWGGIFVASGPDFEHPIPEKRTAHQASVLAAFAEAYAITGARRWLDAALAIDRYLREWMRAEDGTFFATQEDEAPSLPPGMSARDYYALPDAARRRHGVPPIDHAVYTDQNARVIEAYVRLHQATGERSHLEVARRAADALRRARQRPEGWVSQSGPSEPLRRDERMRAFAPEERAFLAPQGPFGLALLALHSVTGEPRWLEAARRIAAGLERLEGPDGGFFASEASPTHSLIGRHRPLEGNLSAARFLDRLGWITHDQALRERARRTVRAVVSRARLARMRTRASLVAQVLEEDLYGPVELTILGDPSDPAARALFEAAARTYEPRAVVRYEAPGARYPDPGRPAVFACTDTACSSPLFEPAAVQAAMRGLARPDTPSCE